MLTLEVNMTKSLSMFVQFVRNITTLRCRLRVDVSSIHNKIRSFVCDETVSVNDNLTVQMKTHMKEKPYEF